MSRSKTIFPAALYCLAVGATSSCTMQTKTQENLGLEAGASAPSIPKAAEVADSHADTASASAGPSVTTSPATPIGTAVPAASSAPTAAAMGGSAAAAPNVSSSSTPVAAAAGPSPHTAQAGSRAIDDDAGTPQTPTQPAVSSAKQDRCNSDLARCLIDSPLNYDGCLRMAANNGCPMPDAGTPPTTVLDDNGNPISQVCQAELAKCIMKLPTPENALACTEKARACK